MENNKKRRNKIVGHLRKKIAVFAQPKAKKLLIRKTTLTKKLLPYKATNHVFEKSKLKIKRRSTT